MLYVCISKESEARIKESKNFFLENNITDNNNKASNMLGSKLSVMNVKWLKPPEI